VKITKQQLTQIINEEIKAALEEGWRDMIPKFKLGTDPDKPFASYKPGVPGQKPPTNAEYNTMRRQEKADHDERSQKIGREKEEARSSRKAAKRAEMLGLTPEHIAWFEDNVEQFETSQPQGHSNLDKEVWYSFEAKFGEELGDAMFKWLESQGRLSARDI
jgi:hypothetical protein